MRKRNWNKVFKSKYKNIVLLILVSVIFCAFLSPYTSVLNPYYGIDTAQYWVIGNGILQGRIPYVDLFDHKGPVIFLVWALGEFIGGGTKWGIFILQNISFVFCLFYIGRLQELFEMPSAKKILTYLAFLFIFCGVIIEGGLTEEWALPWTIYNVYISLSYIQKKNTRPLCLYAFLSGIQFAFIAWMRINNAAGIGAVVLFLFIYLIKKKEYREILSCALTFIGGLFVVTAPLITWFGLKGGLQELLFASFRFNYTYAVGGLSDKTTLEWMRFAGFTGVTFLILLFHWLKEMTAGRTERRWEYLLSFIMVIVCGFSCILGGTYPHYFMVYLPAMMLVMSVVSEGKSLRQFMFILLAMILPYSWQTARNVGKNILFIGFDYYGNQQNAILEISEVIPEDERDSVWALEWCSSKWFAVNDLVPCYKVFDFPHVLNAESLYGDTAAMLENNPPKWILRKKDAPDYVEGYLDFLEENYVIEGYVNYTPQKITDAPEELVIEIWRREE